MQCIKTLAYTNIVLKVISRNNILYLKHIKYEKLYETLVNIFNK